MVFRARLKRHGPVWQLWRAHHRVSGELYGVAFRFVEGGDFVTGELAAEQVLLLERHTEIEIEAQGRADLPAEPVMAFDDGAHPPEEPELELESGIPLAPVRGSWSRPRTRRA